MYCNNCGQEINDQAVVCPHCGCATQNNQPAAKSGDAKSMGWAILGFFFPLIGLILFLVWKKDYPLRASSAGKGALIGFIVNVVMYVLSFVTTLLGLSGAAITALML